MSSVGSTGATSLYLAPYTQIMPGFPGLRPIQWPTVPVVTPTPAEGKPAPPWVASPNEPYDRLNRTPLPDLPLPYISNLGPHLPHHGMQAPISHPVPPPSWVICA
jgi:hypothetical protein